MSRESYPMFLGKDETLYHQEGLILGVSVRTEYCMMSRGSCPMFLGKRVLILGVSVRTEYCIMSRGSCPMFLGKDRTLYHV